MTDTLPFRQIHLDFHTSPQIRNVGIDFSPSEFVATLQAARVNSVTVFARCHHGYCYYPTSIGTPHPHLTRPDLLGELVTACRDAGIRVGGYTTVTWDELAWETHPEWRHMTASGGIGGPAGSPFKPGWKNLCMNTGYADYVIAQVEEMTRLYDMDEVFIDIVQYIGQACVCSICLQQMQSQGIDPEDYRQLARFSLQVERNFMRRAADAIRAIRPECGIFHNSRLVLEWDPELGNGPELSLFTHLEIESLPGGFWGYDHFPLFVRYFQTSGQELVAMTGRFHTTWGDFGGLRNRAALEFECFQALAHGAKVSIGDQLHPRGRLNPAVYTRIGEVYSAVEAREAWSVDTQALPEIGVITTNGQRGLRGKGSSAADTGSLHMLEQLKYQFAFLDAGSDLSPYEVIILPDSVYVDVALAERLRAYLQQGGKLLISNRSGIDDNGGDYLLAQEMGVNYNGLSEYAPDYLVLNEAITTNIEPMLHVCELPGVRLRVSEGTQVLAYSGMPYFNRTWQHFCSHQYSPFDRASDEPVIVQNNSVITIARPLFTEYAESARRVHKQVIANCTQRLLPQPRVGAHNLPSTAVVTVHRQHNDLIVHVLHYVHQRRGRTLDIIEDVLPLHDVSLSIRTERQPTSAQLVPEHQQISCQWEGGYALLSIPRVEGYQIIQVKDAL
jgi:hypothetical protein